MEKHRQVSIHLFQTLYPQFPTQLSHTVALIPYDLGLLFRDEEMRRLLEATAALNKKTAADPEAIIERQSISISDIEAIIERQAELYREFDEFLKEVK